MFTSFDENAFFQAIEDRNYLRLKVNTVSTMLNDPTFERGETKRVLEILQEKVPEIFEDYVELGYEERLERDAWDKRYFSKLTYWFQENFAKERLTHIKEVGRAVHADTAKQYAKSKAIQNMPVSATNKQKKVASKENRKGNFPIAGALLAVGALVLVGVLLAILLTR